MTSFHPSKLLQELVCQLIDETIDEQGIKQLEAIFEENPEARQWYLEESMMDSSLYRWASTPEIENIGVDEIIQRHKRRSLRISILSSAAVLLMVVIAMRLFFIEEQEEVIHLAFEIAPGTQFVLTHSTQEDAAGKEMILEHGSRLQISQGVVELNFSSGARSIVMAPADMTLHDDDILYMREGTAWFHVPHRAKGFQVKTSDLHIVDLGTEFGVEVKPDDHDEVHVLKGKVRVTAQRLRKESALLTAKDSCRIDPVGRLLSIVPRTSIFLKALPNSLPYLHWSFDEPEGGAFPVQGSFTNTALADAAPRQSDCSSLCTSGKFGDAVAVDQYSDELVTGHSGIGGSKPRSVACWIKIKRPPSKSGQRHTIVGWGDRHLNMGSLRRWQIAVIGNGDGGSNLGIVGVGSHRGMTVLNENQWYHIVCTWSPDVTDKSGELTVYVDGKLESIFCENQPGVPDTYVGVSASPIVIGATMNNNPGIKGLASLGGVVDEVFVIQGVLNQQQVIHLMKTNTIK